MWALMVADLLKLLSVLIGGQLQKARLLLQANRKALESAEFMGLGSGSASKVIAFQV